MAQSTETTIIEQGDAALEAQNVADGTPHDFFQGSGDDDDDTEDPVTRGQRTINSLPMYRAVVPKQGRGRREKTGAPSGPSGYIPNLTPGAKRIP